MHGSSRHHVSTTAPCFDETSGFRGEVIPSSDRRSSLPTSELGFPKAGPRTHPSLCALPVQGHPDIAKQRTRSQVESAVAVDEPAPKGMMFGVGLRYPTNTLGKPSGSAPTLARFRAPLGTCPDTRCHFGDGHLRSFGISSLGFGLLVGSGAVPISVPITIAVAVVVPLVSVAVALAAEIHVVQGDSQDANPGSVQ